MPHPAMHKQSIYREHHMYAQSFLQYEIKIYLIYIKYYLIIYLIDFVCLIIYIYLIDFVCLIIFD